MAQEATARVTVEAARRIVEAFRSSPASVGMGLRTRFAALVTRLLKENDWSQRDLAEKILPPMSESSVSAIVHADENLTLETIGRVLFAFRIRDAEITECAQQRTVSLPSAKLTIIQDKTHGNHEEKWFAAPNRGTKAKPGDSRFLVPSASRSTTRRSVKVYANVG